MQIKYTMLERLGGGGQAEVYRGLAESLEGFKRVVAIKRVLLATLGRATIARTGTIQVCTSAAALRSTIGAAYWPEEQQRLERWLAAARATLGAATYAEAEARGGATAPEEAVRLVLVANSQ